MTVEGFLSLDWADEEVPLIAPPRFSPLIADPSFLFPEETGGRGWLLFAHSAWGIHEYRSFDGVTWKDRGLTIRNAMRPFVRRIAGEYLLLYERYAPLALPLTILPKRPRWKSRIELRSSVDLSRWTPPTVLAEPSLSWMRDPVWGDSVSNPCLVQEGDRFRLYHSASLSHVDDCGFEEPRFIACAETLPGAPPSGPYLPRKQPLIDPGDDEQPGVMGAGALKVLRMDDGWIGLQNKIYADGENHSRSAIFALRSGDGLSWSPARQKPLIAPCGNGWRSTHIYGCDCRFREEDGRWYLYYNARDGWYKAKGRERIGRMTALVN